MIKPSETVSHYGKSNYLRCTEAILHIIEIMKFLIWGGKAITKSDFTVNGNNMF